MARLSDQDFRSVVAHAPLVSIDLLVRRGGRYLLGRRANRPAQGYLFVPGGRIYKDERIVEAFARIVRDELGLVRDLGQARFVAVNEHLYADSRFDSETSTHYVVLSYRLELAAGEDVTFDCQHEGEAIWLTLEELRAHPETHPYTILHFARES